MKTILALGLLVLLGACAEVPTDPDAKAEFEQTNDPLEPMNRKVFAFNNQLDHYVMEPVARGYRDTVPDPAQQGVHNVLVNLHAPYVAGNDLLQGDPAQAADMLGRFLINSTFGLLGLRDVVASSGGAKAHDNDLGLTMGHWGVGEGPFLMLPFFGPSNPRDTTGLVANFWADPADAVLGNYGTWPVALRFGVNAVDTRVELLDPLDEIKRSSLDLYATLRSLYRQQRRSALEKDSPQTSQMPP
jgi:phospholipid-binding lipoprotein MlaA